MGDGGHDEEVVSSKSAKIDTLFITKMEGLFKKVKFCTQKVSNFIVHKYGHILSLVIFKF